MDIKKNADELILFLALICLYFTSVYSYLFFHTISEMFSIIIGMAIFIIAWNTRKFSQSDYFIFLGIAYLFVSGIDFVHTLAYKGMSIFVGYDANLPTQLWILARYTQSISLLISPIFITRKVNVNKVFISYLLAIGFFMASIFYWGIFPTCFVEGKGLTQFKIISEYIISVILLFGLYFLHKRKAKLDDYIYKLIVLSILLTIAGEITFTTYLSVYGFSNMLGHYLKVIAFFLIYNALIVSNLENPYSMLFRELKESEENYANLFNKMLNGFASHEIILDEDGNPCDYRFIDVNPAFERMTGLKKKDIIGKTVLEILPKTERIWIERYGKVTLEETPASFSSYSIEFDKHFEVTAYSPQKGFFAAIFRDITEQKKAEKELEKMRAILLETGRMAKVGGWEFDTETMKQTWTEEVYDIHELPYEFQPTVNNGIEFYLPSSRSIIEKAVNDAINEGKPFDLELEFDTAKGNHIWVHAIGKAHMQNGEVIKVSGTIQDITRQKSAEDALKESEEKHRNLFETMIQGVVYQDAEGNIISANPSSERILGLTLDQMKGRTSVDPRWRSIHEDGTDFPGDTHPAMISLKTGKEVNSIMGVFNPKYEEYRWININAVPLFKKNDKNPYRVYTTFEDITERKKAEKKVYGLNEALRVLNKILRHDILNDLTVVLSACDMIHADDDRLKQKASKAITKSVSLIEQMRSLENALVSNEALAGKSLENAVESVAKNYPDIKFSIKGDCTVLCDGAIYSVIDNIVRNAVVHGKTDRIDITIDDNGEMRIADYGKGISSDIKDKIFEEGESFGDTRGSGLGLYIVKKIIERYGGDIRVEDNKPNGAVFVLKFEKT